MIEVKVVSPNDVLITLTHTRTLGQWKYIKSSLESINSNNISIDFANDLYKIISKIEERLTSENLIDEE